MNWNTFKKLDKKEIKKVILEKNTPKCVAIMLDGTRRILKASPGYENDGWLYYKNHLTKLVYKSMDAADFLFDVGIKVVIGPLISVGNLERIGFVPTGIERLMGPLLDPYCLSICKKHKIAINFYGNVKYIRTLKGGEVINKYLEYFQLHNPKNPSHHILIGLGFATDVETKLIADIAINYYKNNKTIPDKNMLIKMFYGFTPPPIDIFIRTNEIKASGGMTPLLTSHNTQLYFPVSPGIISFSEALLKMILYDYLYERKLSGGKHEHKKFTKSQASKVSNFYFTNKNKVIGTGKRLGDIWIPNV